MKFKSLCTLLLLSSVSSLLSAHHKIVYLISTPRSLSTLFLRAMHARGDMSIFNEPSIPVWYGPNKAWYGTLNGIEVEQWYRPGFPKTCKEVVDRLLAEAEVRSVFAKEMSYMVKALIKEDDRLLNDHNVVFAILLRNPHHSIISFYKKWGGIVESFDAIIGYKECYELYQHIKQQTGQAPCIVITEEFYMNPAEAMKSFCEQVGIPFLPDALQWQSLGKAFDGVQEWHEAKIYERTHYWHGDAIMSTGVSKPHQYEVDSCGNPTFSEIEKPEDRERCKQVYEQNMYYYKLILQSIDK
jgi:hypothetical protein